MSLPAPASTVLLLLLAVLGRSAPAMDCESLKSLSLPGMTITAAEVVPEGPFKPNASAQQGAPTVHLAAYCRVAAVIAPTSDSHIETEVWMPADAAEWNGKLQSVGNG